MGILGWMKNQFIDVIEWLDNSNDTLVWRFPDSDHEIKNGAKLTVREGQVAIFVNEGQMGDVFTPGLYSLTTQNLPILTSLASWKYGFNSPFKAEVYFINTRQYMDLRWGTMNPIMLRDPDFGMVRLRAFGLYAIQVADAQKFMREVVGTDGHFTTHEIDSALKRMLVSSFTTAIGEAKIPAIELAGQYELVAEKVQERMSPKFEAIGLALKTLVIENISLPESVEKAIDTRAEMGAIGNMQRYTQFQSAGAIRAAAQNPGGMAGDGMGLAAGMAMGNMMAGSMANAMGGAPAAAAGPPPMNPFGGGAAQSQYYIHLNGQQMGPYGTDVLKQGVQSGQFTAESPVWREGMAAWQPASQVPELASLFTPSGSPGEPPPFGA